MKSEVRSVRGRNKRLRRAGALGRTAKKSPNRGIAKWTLSPLSSSQDTQPMGGDEMKKTIESTLAEFGIEAEVTHMEHRSGVTCFKLLAGSGVYASRICKLSGILSLALNMENIRIRAPIAGKRVVVIEVPNPQATMVMLHKLSNMMRIAFIEIRGLAWNRRAKQAGDLADAFHALPADMWREDFNLQFFRDAFVRQYQRKHPGGRLFDYVALVDKIIAMKD